jgi:hypothetical protein
LIAVVGGALVVELVVAMLTLRAISGTWEKLGDLGDQPDEDEMWVYRAKLAGLTHGD